ncbi:MAG: hypothetical protein BJ554DRAFT_5240 [Olpidium bornovanus]|uniref:Exonuclease domain-containing protein n=1 Tax=Olpidium bornovanus TaxID=278681 RepID=A0A8H8DEW9_9FUNG|nr:MAG: hypothetical protein BJ554DRAFT_5240 [Olpidium bornovanus]
MVESVEKAHVPAASVTGASPQDEKEEKQEQEQEQEQEHESDRRARPGTGVRGACCFPPPVVERTPASGTPGELSVRARLRELGLCTKGSHGDARRRLLKHEKKAAESLLLGGGGVYVSKPASPGAGPPNGRTCPRQLGSGVVAAAAVPRGRRKDDCVGMAEPCFDYFLCLDVEATCEEGRGFGNYQNEIIEWPVLMVDASTFEIVRTRRLPLARQPWISHDEEAISRHLTNSSVALLIPQLTFNRRFKADVEAAPSFAAVLRAFEAWLRERDAFLPGEDLPETPGGGARRPRRAIFVTDGPWDLRDHVRSTLLLNPDVANPHPLLSGPVVDIRRLFQLARPAKANFEDRSLSGMLRAVGLKFEGREHCGVDDARNVARLLERLANLNSEALQRAVRGLTLARSRRWRKVEVQPTRWLDPVEDRRRWPAILRTQQTEKDFNRQVERMQRRSANIRFAALEACFA